MTSGSASAPLPDAWRPGASPATTPSPDTPPPDHPGDFVGTRTRLFGLAFRAGMLTVVTLGFYRFWMKTRLRRFYWSGTRIGGYPLEYTGDPMEKLLGFLIAVVFLAFYIGLVNMVLMFVSLSFLQDDWLAYALSFAGAVPLWFYARYRARRYVVGRTRWRGIRLAMDPGAWGYVWRALLYWGLTLATLGLLWPLMTFALTRYQTDRTWWGDRQLHQGGRWTMLLRPAGIAYAAALGLVALTAWVLWWDPISADLFGGEAAPAALPNGLARLFYYIPLMLLLSYGMLHYTVRARGLMASHTSAGEMRLEARPDPLQVLGIYVLGGLLLSLLSVGPVLALLFIMGIVVASVTVAGGGWIEMLSSLPQWVSIGFSALLYFTFFLMWSAVIHITISMPVWAHYARTLRLIAPEGFEAVAQRDRDDFAEADGFAEALDVGAAI